MRVIASWVLNGVVMILPIGVTEGKRQACAWYEISLER